MSRFHDLEVTDIRNTTRDAVVVTLRPLNGAAAEFDFIQGQYLTFRREFDGEELRRSYSICSGAGEGVLQVGIKRVEGGAFSSWANEALKVGEVLQAMAPMGRFHAPLDPSRGRHYLGFAAGSGITPVLSILRTTLAREPHSAFTLVYANKGVNTIMFREELEDLKNTYLGRFNVIHVPGTDAQEIDLFTGRLTQEKCTELFRTGWVDAAAADIAYICGPEPMMLNIAAALREAGMADERIRFELFASAQTGRLKRPPRTKTAEAAGTRAEITVTLDGATRTVTADAGQSLLDAALGGEMDAPFACRAGVCSTCRCRVIEGEVEMAVNHALEDYEVEKGYVLSCQARPVTDRVRIDYDQ
ncbi:MAG: 2Fe-2S iron-sulfur cluster-binding protein [Roseovarius sp.]|nr:2Fe-2S iron-sulfur cluster-binding protein [Roseovarius sp.]